MIQVFTSGSDAEAQAPPNETRLNARPLFRMNHWGTIVLLLRLIEPCPSNLIEKNPTRRVIGVLTRLITKQASPKMRAIAVVITLWPFLSIWFPINPISRPAVTVPIEYIPETMERLQPNSPIYESIKTETLYVCPGPEKKMVNADIPTIIQP
jgi:hypothetical protein